MAEDQPSRSRALLDLWALLLVQVAAVAAVCTGVALIYPPAAFIVAGLAVIYAVERGA